MPQQESNTAYIFLGLRITSEFSAIIVLPLVLAFYVKKYIDRIVDAEWIAISVTILIAACIAAPLIMKRARYYGRQYQELINKEKKTQKNNYSMENLHIPAIAAEPLFTIGSFTIVNTYINTWLGIAIFIIIALVLRKRLAMRPGTLQNAFEFFIELLLGYFDQVTGDRKKTMKFFPLVGTIFFFILLSNWLGLLPGTGSLTLNHAPVLRPANTDLNLTVAMALVSVIASHIFAFVSIGFFTHIGKFIQIKQVIMSISKGPMAIFTALIEFFVGILEMISEIAKVFSLSFRLFGNIFAGEVLLSVMSALVGIVVPAPFMLLEVLVGLIQASVFAMLTLVYLTVASSAPHGQDHGDDHSQKQPAH